MDKKGAKQKTAKEDKKPVKAKPKHVEAEDENFRQLVRVSGFVLDGNKELWRVLPSIKGMGYNTTNSLLRVTGLDRNRKLGSLSEKEVEELENHLKTLQDKLPVWMINRRNDPEHGQNTHLIGSDLDIANREDITKHKKIKSYKGIRHILGLPVRGQRTRTSFRKGSTIGVSRKKGTK